MKGLDSRFIDDVIKYEVKYEPVNDRFELLDL